MDFTKSKIKFLGDNSEVVDIGVYTSWHVSLQSSWCAWTNNESAVWGPEVHDWQRPGTNWIYCIIKSILCLDEVLPYSLRVCEYCQLNLAQKQWGWCHHWKRQWQVYHNNIGGDRTWQADAARLWGWGAVETEQSDLLIKDAFRLNWNLNVSKHGQTRVPSWSGLLIK